MTVVQGLNRLGPARAAAREPIVESAAPQDLEHLIERVAPTEAAVLIAGERGSAKGLVGQMIHARSRRAAGPFVAINCGAVAPGLIEAELFGYERSGTEGAARVYAGVFERAEGGTLLLDELAQVPFETQAAILRVLDTRAVSRIGGTAPIPIDVRVIATAHRSPQAAAHEGALRPDLLARFTVLPLPRSPALASAQHDRPRLEVPVGSRIDDVERSLIEATLAYFEGNKRRAAEALGCSLKTLYNKLNSYCRKHEYVNS
jgi:two-component system nitrogen regulation response regulator NtrX